MAAEAAAWDIRRFRSSSKLIARSNSPLFVRAASASATGAVSFAAMSTVSRRTLLRAGLLGVASCALRSRVEAAGELPLITKPIPRSGEKIPVIGLGTIWYRDASYPTLKQVIQRLFELGGTVIDTAAICGESEGVIGRALQELNLRQRCFLATKFDAGHMPVTLPSQAQLLGPGPGGVDGPPPGVIRPMPDGIGGRASFERSLQRLRTDHLDLLQVHTMSDAEALLLSGSAPASCATWACRRRPQIPSRLSKC
jgi:Aldo/keto reductase family